MLFSELVVEDAIAFYFVVFFPQIFQLCQLTLVLRPLLESELFWRILHRLFSLLFGGDDESAIIEYFFGRPLEQVFILYLESLESLLLEFDRIPRQRRQILLNIIVHLFETQQILLLSSEEIGCLVNSFPLLLSFTNLLGVLVPLRFFNLLLDCLYVV